MSASVLYHHFSKLFCMDMRQIAFFSCLQDIRMRISKREEQKTDWCRRYYSRRKKSECKNKLFKKHLCIDIYADHGIHPSLCVPVVYISVCWALLQHIQLGLHPQIQFFYSFSPPSPPFLFQPDIYSSPTLLEWQKRYY